MKKYLYSIFAAVLAVGCTHFDVEQSLPVEAAGVPTIVVNKVEDTSISATITAPEGSSFYSYAVMAGAEAQLDSATLFKLGYKSKAVANGTVNYKKNSKGFEVVAGSADKPLSRNADYTIYAVAANEQGTIGKVVAKTVHTTDGQAPKPSSLSAEGNVLTLKFSEAVSYNSGKPATAKYYASNLVKLNEEKDAIAEDGCMGDAKVAAEMAEDGASVKFTVTMADGSALPAGAIYAVSYPAGAFQDKAGNAMAALTSGPVAKDEKIAWANACSQIANKAWSLIDEDAESTTVPPSTEAFFYSIPEDVVFFEVNKDAKVSMKVEAATSSVVSEATYTLGYKSEWGFVDAASVAVVYPEGLQIDGGNNLTISFEEGVFVDIYGNKNAAFSHRYLYSFNFPKSAILGTYVNAGKSGYGAAYNEDPWSFTISESDDPKKGNVMVTEWYGMETKIYASFNKDNGLFEMPLYYESVSYEIAEDESVVIFWYTFGYYSCQQKQKTTLQLYMTEPGVFTEANDYPGYYYEIYTYPASGNLADIDEDKDFVDYDYNIFTPSFTKQGAEVASPKASAKNGVEKNYTTFEKVDIRRQK